MAQGQAERGGKGEKKEMGREGVQEGERGGERTELCLVRDRLCQEEPALHVDNDAGKAAALGGAPCSQGLEVWLVPEPSDCVS